ncbi:uncharacterized protein V1518DRAFT_413153 [Limtongia smithiae]|uniref:uncharacterized protein n=1 Tax=Limtongia smithiae TaxID=1125753 RepID=UPI0034CE01C5
MSFQSGHLSTFDDFLTAVLVDSLYFWITVLKVHPSHRAPRGPPPATITSLVRDNARDPCSLLSRFLELQSVRSYVSGFSRSGRLSAEFKSHAKRYLCMYLPSVPYELGTTERYRAASHRSETCVIARAHISALAPIPHLTGKMVALSTSSSADVETLVKRDFSIIYSHRLGESCLMLGPCRFVNHDCAPNSRFVAHGVHGVVAVVALRDIIPGEEITVSYADNYFGAKNRECMCATCKLRGRGYFRARIPSRSALSRSMTPRGSAHDDEVDEDEHKHDADDSETECDSDQTSDEDVNSSGRVHRTRSAQWRKRESRANKEIAAAEEAGREYGNTTRGGLRRSTRAVKRPRRSVYEDEEEVQAKKRGRAKPTPVWERLQQQLQKQKQMQGVQSRLLVAKPPPGDPMELAQIYNVYHGSLEKNASSDIQPDNFQYKRCMNENCNLTFLLACGSKSAQPVAARTPTRRSRAASTSKSLFLDTECEKYVQSHSRKHLPLRCLRCNRHTAIYGQEWPHTSSATSRYERATSTGSESSLSDASSSVGYGRYSDATRMDNFVVV